MSVHDKNEKQAVFFPSKPNVLFESALNAQVLVKGNENNYVEKKSLKQVFFDKAKLVVIAIVAIAGSGFLVNCIMQLL